MAEKAKASSSFPLAAKAAVPSPCELAPTASPRETGSFTLRAFRVLAPKLAPISPPRTTRATAWLEVDPITPQIATARGEVIWRVIVTRLRSVLSPISRDKTPENAIPNAAPPIVPPSTLGALLKRRFRCSNILQAKDTTEGPSMPVRTSPAPTASSPPCLVIKPLSIALRGWPTIWPIVAMVANESKVQVSTGCKTLRIVADSLVPLT
mmetsp:Transcript_20193/g.29175  ORF Transcript_20193/g.29175 Transcript_20193/m.29175 type:complete len:209 (+) Transcript_20193:181-807(+)